MVYGPLYGPLHRFFWWRRFCRNIPYSPRSVRGLGPLIHVEFDVHCTDPLLVSLVVLFQKRTLPSPTSLRISNSYPNVLRTSIQTHTSSPSRWRDSRNTPFFTTEFEDKVTRPCGFRTTIHIRTSFLTRRRGSREVPFLPLRVRRLGRLTHEVYEPFYWSLPPLPRGWWNGSRIIPFPSNRVRGLCPFVLTPNEQRTKSLDHPVREYWLVPSSYP